MDQSVSFISLKNLENPLDEMDQNKAGNDLKTRYLKIQKEKALSKVKVSPIKKPKTPEKIRKMVRKELNWKIIDPDRRQEQYP